MQRELGVPAEKKNGAPLKDFGFVQDVHLDWLPPQPPSATGIAVGVFLQARVGDSLLHCLIPC